MVGDIVVVLFGSSMPWILRPLPDDDTRFDSIGEAVIDGIMEGELVDAFDAGKYESRSSTIV